jgi:hypothetical protein
MDGLERGLLRQEWRPDLYGKAVVFGIGELAITFNSGSPCAVINGHHASPAAPPKDAGTRLAVQSPFRLD